MNPIEAATVIRTLGVPLVERWDDAYVVTFEDAAVSVTLTEEQVRGLGARILAATLDEIDDMDESA